MRRQTTIGIAAKGGKYNRRLGEEFRIKIIEVITVSRQLSMDSNVVSSLVWVKRGFAKANPKEYEIDEEDINEMKNEPLVKRK